MIGLLAFWVGFFMGMAWRPLTWQERWVVPVLYCAVSVGLALYIKYRPHREETWWGRETRELRELEEELHPWRNMPWYEWVVGLLLLGLFIASFFW
jgi:hypothetical protein